MLLERSSEVQQGLIFIVCIWLLFVVVFPLYEVVYRSLNAELSVAIFGENDIRLAGHRVLIEDDEVLIDEQPVNISNGKAEHNGVLVELTDSKVRVECRRARIEQKEISIQPITVLVDGEEWWIEGEKLSDEEWRRTVNRFVGLLNFITYFTNEGLYTSANNSLFVAILTTAISVNLAFFYAYGLTRTNMFGKSFFRLVAMLPLFAPIMLYGLSLVYLFGNKGVITPGFFGNLNWLAFDINLYGLVGIVIAEVAFTFPPALIILI